MDFFAEIFQYRFLANALLAALLSGVACGIIGTYIVTRRLVFLSGGITHASFGGIGIAYYFGLNPLLGAVVFAVLSAFGIEYIGRSGRMREDSAIGILWSLGMAVGIIFVFLTPGYAPNLMSFLFGNMLLVSPDNIALLAAYDLLLVLVFALSYRSIVYAALDREYARSQRLPVKFISYAMMVLVATGIVLNIKIVGIVLLISLLTLPVAIVNTLTQNYRRIMVFSCATAAVASIMGLYISYIAGIPAGASAVVVLAAAFGIVRLVRWLAKRKTA